MAAENRFDIILSREETPCRVTGEGYGRTKTPVLSLSKWEGEAQIIMITALRGERVREIRQDNNSVTLTTNHRQHRYRQLDHNRFEYDIILAEQPRSPVFTIPLEFPRGVKFYKQESDRHTIPEHLKGSYAVYGSQKNNRYRTGKLCHIHRPEIIDAKGRRVWGELAFDGDNLHIIAPEAFLKTARYPVVVDPVVGSTTRGALHTVEDPPDPPYNYSLEACMPLDEVNCPTSLGTNLRAYCWVYDHGSDETCNGIPVIYWEDPQRSWDCYRITTVGDALDMSFESGDTEGWRGVDMSLRQTLTGFETVWFGFFVKDFLFTYYDLTSVEWMDISGLTAPPDEFWYEDDSMGELISQYFTYDTLSLNFSKVITDQSDPQETLTTPLKGITRRMITPLNPGDLLIRSLAWVRGLTAGLTLPTTLQGARKFFAEISGSFIPREKLTAGLVKYIRIFTKPGVWDYLQKQLSKGIENLTLASPITTERELKRSFFMKRIYVDQSRLLLTVNTGINLEEAVSCEIRYRKPDKSEGSFSAEVSDSALGIISYKVEAGDLDVEGWWDFWAYVRFTNGDEAPGRKVGVFVWG